jgi:purine-binding chemotaxis protein CheW
MIKQENEIDLDDDDEYEEDTQKDKYLIFHLANEDYGIEVCYVREIIGVQKITEVPDTEDFLKGVINLRGKIIPVIDVRTRFNFEFKPYNERTSIIVVYVNSLNVGLIVDGVSEVLNIPESQMESTPKTNKGSKSRFVKGMGKAGDKVKIILSPEQLLNDEAIEQITENILV